METDSELGREEGELLEWLDAKRRHVVEQVRALPAEARRRWHVPSGWTPRVLHQALDLEYGAVGSAQ